MSADSNYLLEFLPIGNTVKVSAVDPTTGTEVSIVGPSTASEAQLSRIAVRKLEYVLAGKRADSRQGDPDSDGIIV